MRIPTRLPLPLDPTNASLPRRRRHTLARDPLRPVAQPSSPASTPPSHPPPSPSAALDSFFLLPPSLPPDSSLPPTAKSHPNCLTMAADKPVSNYEDVFEEGDVPKEAQTVHRIRANSTIMQLNKILGECAPLGTVGRRRRGASPGAPLQPSRLPERLQNREREVEANGHVAHDSCQQR